MSIQCIQLILFLYYPIEIPMQIYGYLVQSDVANSNEFLYPLITGSHEKLSKIGVK